MSREPKKYLHDMLDRARAVSSFVRGRESDDLNTDRLFRSAVERELMVLGEALYQLHETDPDLGEQINSHREIIGFRHVLVHGYHSLRADVLWQTIIEDIPPLIEQLDSMLSDKK